MTNCTTPIVLGAGASGGGANLSFLVGGQHPAAWLAPGHNDILASNSGTISLIATQNLDTTNIPISGATGNLVIDRPAWQHTPSAPSHGGTATLSASAGSVVPLRKNRQPPHSLPQGRGQHHGGDHQSDCSELHRHADRSPQPQHRQPQPDGSQRQPEFNRWQRTT